MSSFVRRSFALIFFAAFIGAHLVFGDEHASANAHADVTKPSRCPKGADCAIINELDKRHIHLGTFDGLDRKPLVITVHKSNLKERRVYAVTALSEQSTGNEWMSIGILNEEEHKEVKGHHQNYYRKILTEKFMCDTMRFGQYAHGIETLSFISYNVKLTPEDLKRLKGYPEGSQYEIELSEDTQSMFNMPETDGPEYSKGSIMINPEVAEGKYYLDFAYGNPFGGPKMVCFKEVIVKVLP
ncbi:hypothetical protein BBBOND_0110760 [Babesia bigemina]|uniref:Uncharacterized protein n=1 Tax=Babesia bigemina TaxID=5866 RepID=A0A061D7A0_BABBI|nr:hypothetical protein BBBOND_0110760 [Babesia bigemina]CDR94779.1 hypothetical protein BBBOND_0110760 [Babesia bigemina]|eukprot:XP_012766965.1 hypothetical protein BBBOND_0110760 [Babesia bigemina]